MGTRSEFLSVRRRRQWPAAVEHLFRPENRIGRAPLRADNTADFIYGTRLLLSCDLTAARAHRYAGAGNARKKGGKRDGKRAGVS